MTASDAAIKAHIISRLGAEDSDTTHDCYHMTELVPCRAIDAIPTTAVERVLLARGWEHEEQWRGGSLWRHGHTVVAVPSDAHRDRGARIAEVVHAIALVDLVSIWDVIADLGKKATRERK